MPFYNGLPRVVFLDRDGVVNIKSAAGHWVTSPEQLLLVPGAAAAIGRLNAAGISVILVTNQRGIGLGLFSEPDLHRIHAHLKALLRSHGAYLDAIYYCPHARDTCRCRKPLPGMFLQAFADHTGFEAATSLMIGDALSDIQAGHALGMNTVLIEGPVETRDPGTEEAARLADVCATSLSEVVEWLFNRDMEAPRG